MAKPVIFSVDDDPEVLRAIERDLRTQYGSEYRVMRSESGAKALEAVRQLKDREEAVALFLVDQRMPQMTGVEFLTQAIAIYPDAKRALLTAYADTDAAIRAINTIKIDYYLLKPWDPPEECLYPVVTDLLEDWRADYHPAFDGIRVIGHRWSPNSHQIKNFLARNQVPYQWFDVERDKEGQRLLEGVGAEAELPILIFPDRTRMTNPATTALAEKIGLKTTAQSPFYDLIVVGGGPAGLAASVYGASEGLRTVMVEREAPGGQAGTSSRIENYLGFPTGLSGADLARRAATQARRFGVEILAPQEAVALRVQDQFRFLKLADGSELSCHALMIATGVSYRKLEVPGIEKLAGAGVYYGAAMTEAISCRDEDVYIVGGANSAGQAAMYFSRFAGRVNMLVRADSLAKGMSQYLVDQITATENIRVLVNSYVVEVHGDTNLTEITIGNSVTGQTERVPSTALFIFIGAVPRTEWLEGVVQRDQNGFIPTGPDLIVDGKRPNGWTLDRDPFLLEASVPGIFVAGDVRCRSVKRVASAVGEGSIAVQFMHQYLASL